MVAAAVAGPAAAAGLEASAWAITPEDAACHTDLDLVSRSGAIAPVALISDGEHVALRFTRQGVPSQAFLPIRVDGKAYANLVQRVGEEGVAMMNLSDETLAALRRGKTLQVAWLSDEAVSGSLAGASQGIAGQHRAREAELDAQRERTQAEARAKAVADEQLATARAQTAAAEAERQRVAAEAQRAQAQAEELAAKAVQERAYAEQAQERTYADQARQQRTPAQQQYYYYNGQPIPPPPSSPPAWASYPQTYYPR
jgi:hypothetical protein